NLMSTDPVKPFFGFTVIVTGVVIPPTPMETDEGKTEMLKSSGGGGGGPALPPQPIRTTKAAQANERVRQPFLPICHLLPHSAPHGPSHNSRDLWRRAPSCSTAFRRAIPHASLQQLRGSPETVRSAENSSAVPEDSRRKMRLCNS